MSCLLDRFILWACRRSRRRSPHIPVVTFEGKREFRRFQPFWFDESTHTNPKTGQRWNRPPWWRPFNVLLHWWNPDKDTNEPMHDHPRWSVTICLRGCIVERTPWGERILRPGSIVVRSRKAIHSFAVPHGYSGKTWTLFVVGRRDYAQNTYAIVHRGLA